ncbi:MAG: 3-keto-disaccharide hydrolase [Opitutales bacterium]|jgi:hypothetical protein
MKLVSLAVMGSLWLNLYPSGTNGEEWISLFNGENLDGWVIKVTGYEVGENPGNLFRVEDGLLTVSYDAFETFNKEFGHIFTKDVYTNYRFRCEYRFIGEQVKDGPKWAFRNSGIMLHSESPEAIEVDKNFPDSLEFQFLGASVDGSFRPTGSFFAVGNAVDHNGEEVTKNVKSKYPARPLGEWVRAEVLVHDNQIVHLVNGEPVMAYFYPREREGTPKVSGHIALQAESHGVQFRNIEILPLKEFQTGSFKWADGWRPLFNGKDLGEFVVEDGSATFEVVDGVITGHTAVPSPNTFLATRKTYGDFELVFEVKVDDKLNSGVQIRSRSRGAGEASGKLKEGRFFGPQVEIEAGPGQAGFIYGEATGRGWLSPEPQSKVPTINSHDHFRNGEWNHYRIVAKGPRIQTYINGRLIADLGDEAIYSTHPSGHIGLQVHSIKPDLHPMSVSWRNLYIREL